jgi:DNA-binding NarL/FixJ family response regulator
MTPIRVVIVDDHRLFLLGVREVLGDADDIEIVGEADSGGDALPLVASLEPDLVLMDVSMPRLDGIACLDSIRAHQPGVKVAMMSAVHDLEVIENALRHGASAFILKSVNPDDLAAVIRHIVSGTVIQSVGVPDAQPAGTNCTDLTERELSILQAVARGLSNQAIAKELWIAQPTVKFHVRNIYRKLGVANRTEATRFAYEHGLLEASAPEASAVLV